MTLEDVIEYEKRDSFDAGLEQGREEGHNIGLIEGFIFASREFGNRTMKLSKVLWRNSHSPEKQQLIN